MIRIYDPGITPETGTDGQLEFVTEGETLGGADPEEIKRIRNVAVALMFTLARPISAVELASACLVDTKTAERELAALKSEMDKEDGALMIKASEGHYELCSNNRYFDELVRVVSSAKKPELSNVLMETLAIIAGKKRATRTDVERIRGVKSDHAVNKLIEYGLIEEKGRLNMPGKPIVFGTTEEFKRRFGVWEAEDLPEAPRELETWKE